MITYLIQSKTGLYGGVCESFQHTWDAAGKHTVTIVGPRFGRIDISTFDYGYCTFMAATKLAEIDLDSLNSKAAA